MARQRLRRAAVEVGEVRRGVPARLRQRRRKPRAALARYFDFYNAAGPHSSLNKQTPDEFYFATLPAIKQAA